MSAAQQQFEEPKIHGRCVVFTGSRDWDLRRVVWMVLNTVYVKQGPFTLFHGACHLGGADEHAQAWGDTNQHVLVRPFPATDYGPWPMCGPIRNEDMVKTAVRTYGRENVHGLAFPRGVSKGTRGTIELMESYGVIPEVWEYERALQY